MLRSSRLAILFAITLSLACSGGTEAAGAYRVVIIPKLVGISYYDHVKSGIDAAAKELLDLEVQWTGPSQDRVEKQIELIQRVIPSRPDLIAVAANDPVAIVPVLKRAKAAGIHVMSWDGDCNEREFFVNLVDYEAFGEQLLEALVHETGEKGEIAIVTTSFTAPNQAAWIKVIKRRIYDRYPGLRIADIRPAGESTEEAYRIARDYLASYGSLAGILVLGVPNVPGVARAVRDAGLVGRVAVVGNSTPNLMRSFLKDGTVQTVVLWSAPDHGYLTLYTARQLLVGGLEVGKPYRAGRLGWFTPRKDSISAEVSLPAIVFTKDNVDDFDF